MSENSTDQPQETYPSEITSDEPTPVTTTGSPICTPEIDAAQELENARKEIRRLQTELDEARSLVAVANYSLEESMETERRKCREEVATLHQLMKENIEEAVRETQAQSDGEIRRLKNLVTRLELEVQELRNSIDKDNPFAAVTKLARKVGSLTNSTPSPSPSPSVTTVNDTSNQDDYLEQSMKKAQEDVEVMRSLVLPLEEEIKVLKDKLRTTDEQLQVYESVQADLVRGTELLTKITADHSFESVTADLASHSDGCDSESVTSDDRLKVFVAIANAQRTLVTEEKERLRSQLQEACKLLENERRQHRELRRSCQKPPADQPVQSAAGDSSKEEKSPLKGFPIKDKIGPLFSRISPVLKRKASAQSPSREAPPSESIGSESSAESKSATRRDPSVEEINLSCSILESTSAPVDEPPKDPNSCTQCETFLAERDQLQEEKLQLEKQLAKSRDESVRLSNLIKDMEHKWTEVAKDYENQVETLFGNVEELQVQVKTISAAFRQFRDQAQETLRQMHFDRTSVNAELVRLQEENDFLVGRNSQHAEQLQNETINLPDNVQELQFACLKLREDLIAAKVAKEAIEKRLHTELMILKDQIGKERQSKDTLEMSLTREIDFLRGQLGMMRSVHTQYDEESKRKASLENALEETKTKLSEAEEQASEANSIRAKLENEVTHLRSRVIALQNDLETSEAVQRDFVQLSQQLQVQLEKIRQSEIELRWQYEEDVDNCSECRQTFGVAKRKHHCRHCCQIFCGDCLRKTVTSGPNKKQSRVCNVCYYLLVQDSAPFFSSEPQPLN